jgi:hypothetical protein
MAEKSRREACGGLKNSWDWIKEVTRKERTKQEKEEADDE